MPHPMPTFGSFALMFALALSAYALLSGALALYAIAQTQKGRRRFAFSPERLRETSRRAGIASFIAVSCAAFALIWGRWKK